MAPYGMQHKIPKTNRKETQMKAVFSKERKAQSNRRHSRAATSRPQSNLRHNRAVISKAKIISFG